MFKFKSTKSALIASVLSFAVCLSMLIGSTFAWFTDSVTTGVNTITAGNLDMKLEYKAADMSAYETVNASTNVFKTGTLWEPGHVEVVSLKLSNLGTLAFKYNLAVKIAEELGSTNVLGNVFKLSDYIKYAVVDGEQTYTDSAAAIAAAVAANPILIGTGYTKADTLAAEGSVTVTLIVYMPTTVGNEANYDKAGGFAAPKIDLGISAFATQTPSESDSFGTGYDSGALFANERLVTNDTELTAALNEALTSSTVDTIILNGSFGAIDLPAGTDNLTIVATNGAAMKSLNVSGAKNVVIDGITFDAAKAATVYTNSNKEGSLGTATNYTASIYDSRYTGSTFESASKNITVQNCTFSGTATVDYENEKGYAPICIDSSGAGGRASDYTVKGCTFSCNAVSYVYFNYMAAGTSVIENNIFGGTTYKTAYGNVGIVNGYTDAMISGNTFYNWDTDDSAIKASCPSATVAENYSSYTVTNNIFNGAVSEKAVIEIRRCGTDHTVSGNNYTGVTGRTCSDTDTSSSSADVTVYFRG